MRAGHAAGREQEGAGWTRGGVRWARDGVRRARAGRFAVVLASLTVAGAAGLAHQDRAAAQETVRGIFVSPTVACRSAPESTAVVVGTFTKTGNTYREIVAVGDSATDRSGARWVSVEAFQGPLRRCWVPESVVVPDSGPDVLLAVADHLLTSPGGYALQDWVAVYNDFRSRRYRDDVDRSALLTLRRLEVLMVALRLAQTGWGDADQRAWAWIESLGDEVEYAADPRGRMRWVVSRDTLEALYDAHAGGPLAEEILWKIARYHHDPDPCNVDSVCAFDLARGVSRYWLAYPRGSFLADAIRAALGRLGGSNSRIGSGGILQRCEAARDAEPDSWLVEAWERQGWETGGFAASRRLLATLGEVAEGDKAPLVRYIGEVERCADEVAAGRLGGVGATAGPEAPSAEADDEAPSAAAEDEAPSAAADEEAVKATRELAVVARGVRCRSVPSLSAPGQSRVLLGEPFTTDRPDTVVDGDAWVSASRWMDCWVPRSLTEVAGSEEHVLAIADHFLDSGERRTLDHSLRVFNTLNSRHNGYRAVVDGSALLTLRRLQVLGEVLTSLNTFSADALSRGWANQTEDVWMWSIGASWYVREEAFEEAFETHRESPWAEDILWALATEPAPHDCEGDFGCSARVVALNRLARYWTVYPEGRHTAWAIEAAADGLGGFLEICRAAVDAEPESREARQWGWVGWGARSAETARELRATLQGVGEADRAPLEELLDGLDRCAARVASGAGSRA